MKHYFIQYCNAGDGKPHVIRHTDAHEAFVDAIEVLDNVSNYNVMLWIENH